jgi:hypothetical protein
MASRNGDFARLLARCRMGAGEPVETLRLAVAFGPAAVEANRSYD